MERVKDRPPRRIGCSPPSPARVVRVFLVSCLVCLLVAGWNSPAAAQEEPASGDEPSGSTLPEDVIRKALEDQEAEGPGGAGPLPPATAVSVSVESLDEESREALFERYRRYQRHHIAMLEHRERLFHWQLTANQISFWMVLVLVFTGLVFAGIQFRTSMLAAKESGKPSDTMQEVSLGAQGITIRSSVIGLIILALSLGFFYLYLVYVFPLDELASSANPPPAETHTATPAEEEASTGEGR